MDKSGNGATVIRFLPGLKVKIFLGLKCSLTPSRVLVVGTSRIP